MSVYLFVDESNGLFSAEVFVGDVDCLSEAGQCMLTDSLRAWTEPARVNTGVQGSKHGAQHVYPMLSPKM